MKPSIPLLLALLALLTGCRSLAGLPSEPSPPEVIVVGTLGSGHLEAEDYTLEDLEELLRGLRGDLLLIDLPPDRHAAAWSQFVRTGEVEDPLVRRQPEVAGVLYPMALEGRIELLPCGAWNPAAEARREALLEQWRTTRPRDLRAAERAGEDARRQLEAEGLAASARGVHTARHDELMAGAWEVYESRLGRDLGEGGWERENDALLVRLGEALDGERGSGRRVLVVVDARRKYRLRAGLAGRGDIVLRRVPEVLPASGSDT